MALSCAAKTHLGLDSYLQARTTPQFRDCGAFEVRRGARMKVVGPEDAPSIACVHEAISGGIPFRLVIQGASIDSALATGLIGGPDGKVWSFWYDSAPCGMPSRCSERLEMTICKIRLNENAIDPVADCEAS
jgi:hypothetical protein